MGNTSTTLSDLEQKIKVGKGIKEVKDGIQAMAIAISLPKDELAMLVAGLNAKIKKIRQSRENDIRNVNLETDQKVIDKIEYRKSEIEKYEDLKQKIALCQK